MSSDRAAARHPWVLARRASTGSLLLLLTLVLGNAEIGSAQAVTAAPVMVGDGPELDACGSVGVVSGLDPKGANALSVRSGPGLSHARLDIVSSGQTLWICGRREGWYAVVYPLDDEDCGVSTPIDPAAPYAGPCRKGWVFEDYVTVVAG